MKEVREKAVRKKPNGLDMVRVIFVIFVYVHLTPLIPAGRKKYVSESVSTSR